MLGTCACSRERGLVGEGGRKEREREEGGEEGREGEREEGREEEREGAREEGREEGVRKR